MKLWGNTPEEKLASVEVILKQMEKKKEDFKKPEPMQRPYSISNYIDIPVNTGDVILSHLFLSKVSINLGIFVEDASKKPSSVTVDIASSNLINSVTYQLKVGLTLLEPIKINPVERLKVKINYEDMENKPMGIWVTGDCI